MIKGRSFIEPVWHIPDQRYYTIQHHKNNIKINNQQYPTKHYNSVGFQDGRLERIEVTKHGESKKINK